MWVSLKTLFNENAKDSGLDDNDNKALFYAFKTFVLIDQTNTEQKRKRKKEKWFHGNSNQNTDTPETV